MLNILLKDKMNTHSEEYLKGYEAGKRLISDVRKMYSARAERDRKSFVEKVRLILVKSRAPAEVINEITNSPYTQNQE